MLTFEKVKELLGVKDLPGSPASIRELVDETADMIDRHGEAWIKEHRTMLINGWKTYVDAMDNRSLPPMPRRRK